MALLLTLIAVPLSRLQPRQGRYARVGLAIVAYFLYSNLLSVAKVWLEKGDLPPVIGRLVGAPAGPRPGSVPDAAGGDDMNTLDRYIYRTVIVYALLAMAVLLTLGALFVFIAEQGDIGKGNYTAMAMRSCSRCSICRSRRSSCCRSVP